MERAHLAIILAITALLLTQPAVGVIQALMVAAGLSLGLRWWSAIGEREVRDPERSKLRTFAVVVLASAACLGIWGIVFEYYWPGPAGEGLWMLAGIPAAALMASMGSARLPGGTRQAVVLGLATTAIWVPIGARTDLDHYLRFHPYAVAALGLGSLVLFALANRGKGRAAWHRLFVMVFVQSLSVYAYWLHADADRAGALGYHFDAVDDESPDGRLAVVTAEGAHGNLVVDLVDSARPWPRVLLASIYPPYSGVRTQWRDDGAVQITWFQPRSNLSGGCEMAPVSVFARDQTQKVVVHPCWESNEPLLCLQPTYPQGAPCERSADCSSQLCRGGVCDRARLGETCVNNDTCEEGTCLRRTCVEPDGEVCDDDRDCLGERYCYRLDEELTGKCYEGRANDPCFKREGQCEFGTSCEPSGPRNLGTCVAGPLHGVVF